MLPETRFVALGTIAGIAAGIAWLVLRGAPPIMPAINLVAAAAGAIAAIVLARSSPMRGRTLDAVNVLACIAIAAPLLFGPRIEGVARWLALGPLQLQPAMILLPLVLILHARDPRPVGTAALALIAVALAFQPDRSMATALAATLLGLAVLRSGWKAWALVVWSMACTTIAFTRPDPLAPVPLVENVLNDAFAHGLGSWLAMTVATVLLISPSFAVRSEAPSPRIAFAICWVILLAASVVGPFPTPVLGFGASGVLGYLLSLAALAASHPGPASRLSR